MPPQTFVHSPQAVILTVHSLIVDGFQDDDEAIKVAYRTEEVTDDVGLYGDVAVIQSLDMRGDLTFKTMQGARINTLLGQIVAGRIAPFSLTDLNSTAIASGPCYLKKRPDFTRGKGQKPLEWMFGISQLKYIVGGNKV